MTNWRLIPQMFCSVKKARFLWRIRSLSSLCFVNLKLSCFTNDWRKELQTDGLRDLNNNTRVKSVYKKRKSFVQSTSSTAGYVLYLGHKLSPTMPSTTQFYPLPLNPSPLFPDASASVVFVNKQQRSSYK